MGSPAYSTLLIASALAGAGSAAFLVPPGFRCVVRDIDLFESNPGGCIFEAAGEGGVVFFGAGPNLTSTFNYYSWRGRLVINAGDELVVSTTLPGNIYASGYLLTVP